MSMNMGSFGLNRTGHGGGASRESNYNSARNYFAQYLQSKFVKLMSKEETDLESWIAKTPDAEKALCDIEVIQQFAHGYATTRRNRTCTTQESHLSSEVFKTF